MSNEQEYEVGDLVEIDLFSGGRVKVAVEWVECQYVGGKLETGRIWSRRYKEVKLISRARVEMIEPAMDAYSVGELVQVRWVSHASWFDVCVTDIRGRTVYCRHEDDTLWAGEFDHGNIRKHPVRPGDRVELTPDGMIVQTCALSPEWKIGDVCEVLCNDRNWYYGKVDVTADDHVKPISLRVMFQIGDMQYYQILRASEYATRLRRIHPAPVSPPTPIDPLDVVIDGVTLRECLDRHQRYHREDPDMRGSKWALLTEDQRAAVSAHWSAELRAKMAAAKERERCVVRYCEIDADE